ncbi:MAG: hypothetical protein MI919_31710, partial [Holophagales bacterium]|nr:hypothetical protein [Holophagales bacterium]
AVQPLRLRDVRSDHVVTLQARLGHARAPAAVTVGAAALADELGDPAVHGLELRPHTGEGPVDLGAPPFQVQLILDDGTAENVFGFGGGTARQFLWLNRFQNPGPFVLEEIQVLFPNGPDVPLSGAVQLAVFLDTDGDPTNGAQLLGTEDVTIQAVDGSTFSVYPLASPIEIQSGGDVLIGVINRYFETGVDPPPTFPAALDTDTSADRSYFALWTADPPDPPDLGSADTIDVLDGVVSGNFLIRGFGSPTPVVEIPTLRTAGLAALIALIAAAGLLVARRIG